MEEQHAPVSPEPIMQMAWGYAASIIMEAGVRTGMFDALAEGALSAEELAQRTGVTPRAARIVGNALVGLQLLNKAGERYTLTPVSEQYLVSGKPSFLGGLLRHISSQLISNWLQLPEVMRTGKPATAVNDPEAGQEFFAEFVEALLPMSFPAAQHLAAHLYPAYGDSASVLDIAAGSGVWSIPFAQQSPTVRVTAVDWPDVLPVTQQITARFGVAEQYRFSPGDLSAADFGSGHQVAVLGHILHSEGEARSRDLLRKVSAALAPGGTIAIAEFVPNEDRTGPAQPLIFAVNMLVNSEAGDTFTFSEMAAWLREAGFENVRELDAPGPSPLILATKA